MEDERLHQETLDNFPVHYDVDTPSREELEREIELLSREPQLIQEAIVHQKCWEDSYLAQRDELLSLEEKTNKIDDQARVQCTKAGFFRTIGAIVYCLVAVPGAILHVLFSDKPYKV